MKPCRMPASWLSWRFEKTSLSNTLHLSNTLPLSNILHHLSKRNKHYIDKRAWSLFLNGTGVYRRKPCQNASRASRVLSSVLLSLRARRVRVNSWTRISRGDNAGLYDNTCIKASALHRTTGFSTADDHAGRYRCTRTLSVFRNLAHVRAMNSSFFTW